MKESNFSTSKSTLSSSSALGIGLLLLSLVFGYIAWQYKQSNHAEEAEEVVSESVPVAKSEVEPQLSFDFNPELIVSDGDTLASILEEADVNINDSNAAINALSKKFNPRKLNIGTVVALGFEEKIAINPILNRMTVTVSNSLKIEVSRNASGDFSATQLSVPLKRQAEHRIGTVKNSFIATATELSIPSNAVMGMIRAFSYDVDFQRDIKRGDKLEVVMDKFYTEEGKLSHTGDILYSSLTLSDKKISIYLYTNSNGETAYYNEKGESIKKEFLRTPVNAARISSKFGMRDHPVLGYTRMHKGVDFAAPTGTPILAAGSGIVESATRFGQYGKYVRIKHNTTYSTAYAHASRFAKGIKPGAKVTQGQVIAYVGTTGVTSGPHLHYEVLEHGKQINPLKFKFSSSSGKLAGKEFEQFKKFKKTIEKKLISA